MHQLEEILTHYGVEGEVEGEGWEQNRTWWYPGLPAESHQGVPHTGEGTGNRF